MARSVVLCQRVTKDVASGILLLGRWDALVPQQADGLGRLVRVGALRVLVLVGVVCDAGRARAPDRAIKVPAKGHRVDPLLGHT